ncbi:hypothetical protein SKAU_G00176900 [Synaphobranchus kaupii]|uniref:Uncharacterized protein n=1 Tax=Synaphobranchus kaupii TaxID=118154 RepID=A0A9Q1FLJ6_SYNKA|nr:hypothetical protein SKAU_G00176900 [Synaphobranchus kaupii]
MQLCKTGTRRPPPWPTASILQQQMELSEKNKHFSAPRWSPLTFQGNQSGIEECRPKRRRGSVRDGVQGDTGSGRPLRSVARAPNALTGSEPTGSGSTATPRPQEHGEA